MRSFLVNLLLLFLISCSDARTDYATKWTNEIKAKIMEDSGLKPDSVFVQAKETDRQIVTTFKNNILLKRIRINSQTKDTLGITYFSKDQSFGLAKEFCPLLKDEYVEVITYKRTTLGLHEFHYCNGKIKKQGFNIGGYVGKWKEYNENGDLVKETDYGNLEKLDTLRKIKYYR